jgi:hypothetical protein
MLVKDQTPNARCSTRHFQTPTPMLSCANTGEHQIIVEVKEKLRCRFEDREFSLFQMLAGYHK